jgi:putative toxin-antitoxin system antitoxin component (TIGR02293 family)
MKKRVNYKSQHSAEELPQVKEPALYMRPIQQIPVAVADFTYKKFKKIADRVPFSLSEWATILHLSERTLQRYAKDNKSFEGIYVDRILHLEQLINMGLDTFNSPEALYEWLKKPKNVLGTTMGFEALAHSQAISELTDMLGRIQHGVY